MGGRERGRVVSQLSGFAPGAAEPLSLAFSDPLLRPARYRIAFGPTINVVVAN